MTDLEVRRYGLRTFRLISRRLHALMVLNQPWALDGTCHARCIPNMGYPTFRMSFRKTHPAPDEDCHCGIYAALTAQHLFDQYPINAHRLIAVIAAEGQTIIGSQGFRTEYARVVAYWTPVRSVLEVCVDRCGDAQWFPELADMLAAYRFPPCELPTMPTEMPVPDGPDWWNS
jgi:hypothetical protein